MIAMADLKGQTRDTLISVGSALKDSSAADRLAAEAKGYLQAKGINMLGQVGDRLESLTGQLESGELLGPGLTEGVQRLARGDSPIKAIAGSALAGVKDKVTNMFGGGGGSKRNKVKVTNIIEDIDVGVPVRVAYNQWTQFGDFPSFMKKVETVDAESDETLNWKAQVFWSHRTWESNIQEQVPDDLIVWRSKGPKGHVDGAVTFHELGPRLTRILMVLEYHPQGLFERTGNIWRAQGRRARLELKHFRRYVMTRTILDEESVEGWRGEIRDGEVVRTHEEALDEEERRDDGPDRDEDQAADNETEAPEDDYDEDQAAEAEAEDEDPEDSEDEDLEDSEDEDIEDGYDEDASEDDREPEDEHEYAEQSAS
jgi:uncharacterized membrane protein